MRGPQPVPPTPSEPPRSRENGNVTQFRVQELERRVAGAEHTLADVQQRVIAIEERMKEVATKSQVAYLVAIVAGLAVFTILGHVALRLLGV